MHFDERSEDGSRIPLQVVGSNNDDRHLVLTGARMCGQFDLDGNFSDRPFAGSGMFGEGNLAGLCFHERLNEAVSIFRVE